MFYETHILSQFFVIFFIAKNCEIDKQHHRERENSFKGEIKYMI